MKKKTIPSKLGKPFIIILIIALLIMIVALMITLNLNQKPPEKTVHDFLESLMKNEGYKRYLDHTIPLGLENATLYCTKDDIGRMIIYDEDYAFDNKLRVLLGQTNFEGLLHKTISISSTEDFVIKSIINNQEVEFLAHDIAEFRLTGNGTTVFKNSEPQASSIFRWYIIPSNGARLTVLNISRGHTNTSAGTSYRGTLEVSAYNGELTLVNEVNLEE